MTLLLLIRHGENDIMHRRLAGHRPGVHLNEKGRGQAQALTQALAHAPIAAVYSSPLERALETAAPLAETRGLQVEIRPALIDTNYGDWQWRTYKQLRRIKLWKTVLESPTQMRFPNGETIAEVQTRVINDLTALASLHQVEPGEEKEKKEEIIIAAVAHADVVRLALTHYLNMALDDFHRLVVFPASISMVHLPREGRPLVVHINQVAGYAWPEKSDPQTKGRKRKQVKNG